MIHRGKGEHSSCWYVLTWSVVVLLLLLLLPLPSSTNFTTFEPLLLCKCAVESITLGDRFSAFLAADLSTRVLSYIFSLS